MSSKERGGASAWERFLRYVAFARRKPTFDLEERVPLMNVAERALAMLEAVARGRAWDDLLGYLLRTTHGGIDGPYNLVNVHDARWLRDWAARDPGSLAGALGVFEETVGDPAASIAAFDEAVRAAAEAGVVEPRDGAVISLGSVFNFARDPSRLPIMRAGLFDHLDRVLGLDPVPEGRPGERYRGLLDRALHLRAEIERGGVPVRDMVDAQSLIMLAAHHSAWWNEPQTPRGPRPAPDSYLAVCAIYRNEASYLREWIEFHRLVGVERFYLYDNGSTDEHLDVLDPYLRDGSVILHDWPHSPGQLRAYADCLDRHGGESRWIAFIDLDEFLFSPAGRLLPDRLAGYEEFPGVVVNCVMFGPGGHRTRPPGLVTESYLRPVESHRNRLVKAVLDPLAARAPSSPHNFDYREGLAVDENGYPVRGPWTKSVSCAVLRINHYVTKSEQEFEAKRATSRADAVAAQPRMPAARVLELSPLREEAGVEGAPDSAITVYLPALRDAVARRET